MSALYIRVVSRGSPQPPMLVANCCQHLALSAYAVTAGDIARGCCQLRPQLLIRSTIPILWSTATPRENTGMQFTFTLPRKIRTISIISFCNSLIDKYSRKEKSSHVNEISYYMYATSIWRPFHRIKS